MNVSAYKQRNLGIISLPTDIKYRNWSKDLTKWRIENDSRLAQYLVYDNKYRLNKDTLAVYEFKRNPVCGQYKAVAFDLKRGIVLSEKSTYVMMQGLMREAVHCDMIWQKMLARESKIDVQQGIIMYNVLYFSMHAYSRNFYTDWICLHWIKDFNVKRYQRATFTSIALDETSLTYNFAFDSPKPNLAKIIGQYLFHNHYYFGLYNQHMFVENNLEIKVINSDSILHNSDYYVRLDLYAIKSLKGLADKFYNHVLNLHLLAIVHEFKALRYLHREHHFFIKKIIKIRYNR